MRPKPAALDSKHTAYRRCANYRHYEAYVEKYSKADTDWAIAYEYLP